MVALALYARNELTRTGLADAAERAGLSVIRLTAEPSSLVAAYRPEVVVRAPGGLVAQAMSLGAKIRLAGPTPQWFVALGAEVTGRSWSLVTPAGARELLARAPAFVKLADAKSRHVPARFYPDAAAIEAALGLISASEQTELLATDLWLDIDSEYRVFTRGRDALTVSPYRVQDEPWTPLLRTHRASFHAEAADYVNQVLAGLPADGVPPAAVIDVARLANGRLVVLEANQCWGAGLYGCDPDEALSAILAANAPDAPGPNHQWLWRPDPASIVVLSAVGYTEAAPAPRPTLDCHPPDRS